MFGVSKELVGAAIFGLASLTDWLDGYLARRRKQVTALGQLMDPLADKLLITAALVSLVQMDLAPAWMVVVVLGREIAVTVLRSLAQSRGISIPASPLGKFKMVSQVTAMLLLILGQRAHAAFVMPGQNRALGRGVHRRRLGDRLLPPLQPRAHGAREPARGRSRPKARIALTPSNAGSHSAMNRDEVADIHGVDRRVDADNRRFRLNGEDRRRADAWRGAVRDGRGGRSSAAVPGRGRDRCRGRAP